MCNSDAVSVDEKQPFEDLCDEFSELTGLPGGIIYQNEYFFLRSRDWEKGKGQKKSATLGFPVGFPTANTSVP